MKGLVFNLLEDVVRREHGDDVWDAVLERAGLEGVYTSLGNYPDAELSALVSAAAGTFAQPPAAVVRWFGRRALPMLAERFPAFFTPHRSTRSFLLALNDIIHPEVHKLYPGADTPRFEFDASAPDVLVMFYASARRLCAFAHGLMEGAAAHYDEEAVIDQVGCMDRGDDRCEFRIVLRRRSG